MVTSAPLLQPWGPLLPAPLLWHPTQGLVFPLPPRMHQIVTSVESPMAFNKPQLLRRPRRRGGGDSEQCHSSLQPRLLSDHWDRSPNTSTRYHGGSIGSMSTHSTSMRVKLASSVGTAPVPSFLPHSTSRKSRSCCIGSSGVTPG